MRTFAEPRRRLLAIGGLVVCVIVVVGVAAGARPRRAGSHAGAAQPPSTAEQERGMTAGAPFADPPGIVPADPAHPLITLAAVPTRFNVSGKSVTGESYNGSFVGPTLYLQPGAQVELNFQNALATSTNLQFEGVSLSPSGDADNVRLSVAPQQTQTYHLNIPADHPTGTFWYHDYDTCAGAATGTAATPSTAAARKPCDDVESQLYAGLAGTIVVGDERGLLAPDLRHINTHILAFKDVQIDGSGHILQNHGSMSIDSNKPSVRLVNGQLRPVLTVRPGETQLWRLANEGAAIFYDLQLDGYHFMVIGEDGFPVAQVSSAESLLLPPGKRYDVLVTAAAQPGNGLAADARLQQRPARRFLPRYTASQPERA